MASITDFTVRDLKNQPVSLSDYRGQVMLIVNVASRCGFTPQYQGLENLYRKFKDRGLIILGFPCNQFLFQEPGGNDSIQQFCTLKYDVSFPVLGKIHVNGSKADPLYRFLKSEQPGFLNTQWIKWNFTKFLCDRSGQVTARYSPRTKPEAIEPAIEQLLGPA
jgi:glutathione peroxidase